MGSQDRKQQKHQRAPQLLLSCLHDEPAVVSTGAGLSTTVWQLRSRDQSGNIARSERYSSLPLTHMVSKLTSVGNLCSPPGSSSRRSRDKSGDVARGQRHRSLASSQGNQREGDDVAEHVETTAPMYSALI